MFGFVWPASIELAVMRFCLYPGHRTQIIGFVLIAELVGSPLLYAQQPTSKIPAGVDVKAAPEADNTSAKTALDKALTDDTLFPKELLGDTTTCGPTLWAALKSSADEALLHSKVVTELLSVPEPLQTVGRGLVTEEQRRAFWKLLRLKYPALRNARIRRADADEIRYYWATVPFDIKEPVFAIEAGPQTFIANLTVEKGKSALFWIDLVGDLHTLRDQVLTADEVQEFVAVAETGLPNAAYPAGRAYFLGQGVPFDQERGRKWLDRAAQDGSFDAQMLLGAAYLSGTRLPRNPQLASKYLLQAAQQRHLPSALRSPQALAQHWVALMYEQGRGLERSHDKAIEFLQMAANNGNSTAQFELAALCNDGAGGMALDKARACSLFQKAADQGHVKAMHNTGYCYQVGVGGRKDANLAIEYYTRAAELGDVGAQKNLGILFGQLGQAERSYFWLRVVESSGEVLRSLIDVVKTHLSSQQLGATEKDIAAWLESHKANQLPDRAQ